MGTKLKNGAEVLVDIRKANGDRYVAALWKDEYVTWTVDDEGNAYLGHYYGEGVQGEAKAFRNVAERAGLLFGDAS